MEAQILAGLQAVEARLGAMQHELGENTEAMRNVVRTADHDRRRLDKLELEFAKLESWRRDQESAEAARTALRKRDRAIIGAMFASVAAVAATGRDAIAFVKEVF